jgi:hypothetical protein
MPTPYLEHFIARETPEYALRPDEQEKQWDHYISAHRAAQSAVEEFGLSDLSHVTMTDIGGVAVDSYRTDFYLAKVADRTGRDAPLWLPSAVARLSERTDEDKAPYEEDAVGYDLLVDLGQDVHVTYARLLRTFGRKAIQYPRLGNVHRTAYQQAVDLEAVGLFNAVALGVSRSKAAQAAA